jgi:hypothetical protein
MQAGTRTFRGGPLAAPDHNNEDHCGAAKEGPPLHDRF